MAAIILVRLSMLRDRWSPSQSFLTSCVRKDFERLEQNIFSSFPDRPSCLTEQKMIYGVSEKETAHISCTVDSNPKADSFFWTLNTTAGHSEIPGAMSTDMAGASLLSYKPMSG